MFVKKYKYEIATACILFLLTGCSTKTTQSPKPTDLSLPAENPQNQDSAYLNYIKQNFSYSNPGLDNDFKNLNTVTLQAPKIPFKPDKIEPYADDLKSGMKRIFLLEYNSHTGQYIFLTVTKNAEGPFDFPTTQQNESIVPVKVGRDPMAFYFEKKDHWNEVYWTNGELLLSLSSGINTDLSHWGTGLLGDQSKPFLNKEDLVYAAESVLNN